MNSKKWLFYVKYLILAAAFALSCLSISVDAVFAEEADSDKRYAAFLYDNSSGLLTSEANAIAQTGIGFVWIGGYGGLTRYDGSEFHHFDPSFGVASVNCLFVDSHDRLWIGTNDSGLAVRQNAAFKFWGRTEGLISLSVRAICEDAAGNIIVATTEGMAYVDSENEELHMIEDHRIQDKYVRKLKADADGVIYGCTMDNSIFSIENLELTSFYTYEELDIGNLYCITPDPVEKGKVYIGTGSDAIVCGNMFDGMKEKEFLSASPQQNINDIYMASDNKMWIAANNGVGYFDEKGKYTELKNSAMNSSIISIMEDFEGNIWFASSRQGVMKVIKSPFTDITGISGLDRVVANTTCIYQGDLYIGTDEGLQLLDKDYNQKENVLTELLDGVRIRSIKSDSSGNLWLCTYSTASDYGIICYNKDGTYQMFNEKSGMVSSKTRTFIELSDGTIAVASSGGVNLIKDGSVIKTYDEKDGIVNTEILSLAEGDDGKLYFGSDGGGLYIVENDKLRCLGLDDGLKSQVIMMIRKDPTRGVYWILTGNSIAYMKDEKIHTLSNFPYSNNFDIQFDANGGIWILSSNGIYFVNGDSLFSDEDLLYSFYDVHSGLPSIATSNSRNYISEDGTLYIAGGTGVSSININTARAGKNDAKLVVPFIVIDDEEIYVRTGETITLPADCKRVTINGIAMTYTHNPQVKYYLEGFDNKATMVSRHEMQPVSYTNLRSGEYTFHMSIIDVMTGNAVNSLEVKIVKERGLYEQPFFWIIVAAAVAALVFLIAWTYVRSKTERLSRKVKEDRILINEIVDVFAKTVGVKDEYTNQHSNRVAIYTKMIAQKAGYTDEEAQTFYNIGKLHDVGKILTPGEILNKPGKLTDEEYEIMKKHASDGYDILKDVKAVPDAALGAGYHHERLDGKGYPEGRPAEEIPDVAQIIAVADTFDAMHSTRPYRKQLPMDVVVAELKRVAGTQLNERYVGILLQLIEDGEIE